ncbi:hypothetical protein [Caloranaerobacter azorensis]|uniref:Uncharacterized protein n=1 Tax=Caloranaerobacter azorensis TaxID=116090 RepID=A0A6P1YAH1_9FIRM|nr:hypothetical protein [Caloranaerobacter azorensis]QIB26064.1 hypothetical protein G3A45_01310 [Caloranaerobacter azorensis]
MNDIQDRIKRMWKYLNENGIYTEEDLDKALEKMPKLNIGIFVSPLKGGEKCVTESR